MGKHWQYLLAISIGLAATFVGYKFLAIDLGVGKILKKEDAPPVNVEPVFSVETIPEDGVPGSRAEQLKGEVDEFIGTVNEVVSQTPPPQPQVQPDANAQYEQTRLSIVENVQKQGSKVLDSRVFVHKEDCDTTVQKLMLEYKKRGIPETDIVETAPFPNSTGKVIMFNINAKLHYAGCVTAPNMDWAVYVQFVR